MNRWFDCIQIWYGCSLCIPDDLINFWDESIQNKMAAAAIKKNDMVVVQVILIDEFCLLAPAVTVGETEGAMDSTSVFFCLFFCL